MGIKIQTDVARASKLGIHIQLVMSLVRLYTNIRTNIMIRITIIQTWDLNY